MPAPRSDGAPGPRRLRAIGPPRRPAAPRRLAEPCRRSQSPGDLRTADPLPAQEVFERNEITPPPGAKSIPPSINGEMRILLRDELAIAGEEWLGGGKEAQRGAGVLDPGPQSAAGDRDRRVLASLEEAVGDGGLHAQAQLGLAGGAAREVPVQAMTTSVGPREIQHQLQVRELDPKRGGCRTQTRAVVGVHVDLAQHRVEDLLELLLGQRISGG